MFRCSFILSCNFRMVLPMYISLHLLQVVLYTTSLRKHRPFSEVGQSIFLQPSNFFLGFSACRSVIDLWTSLMGIPSFWKMRFILLNSHLAYTHHAAEGQLL